MIGWEEDRAAGFPLDLRIERDMARRQAAEPQGEEHGPEYPELLPWSDGGSPLEGDEDEEAPPAFVRTVATDPEEEEAEEEEYRPTPMGAFERREIAEAEAQRDAPRVARALSVYASRRFAEAAERRLRRTTRRGSVLRSDSQSSAPSRRGPRSEGSSSVAGSVGLGSPSTAPAPGLSPALEVEEPVLMEEPEAVGATMTPEIDQAAGIAPGDENVEDESEEEDDTPARAVAPNAALLFAEAAERRRRAALESQPPPAQASPTPAPVPGPTKLPEPSSVPPPVSFAFGSAVATLATSASVVPSPTASSFTRLFPTRSFGQPLPTPPSPAAVVNTPPPATTPPSFPHSFPASTNLASHAAHQLPPLPLSEPLSMSDAAPPAPRLVTSSLTRRPTVSTGPPPPPSRHHHSASAPTSPAPSPRGTDLVRRRALNRSSMQASQPAVPTSSMLSYIPREDREAMGAPIEPARGLPRRLTRPPPVPPASRPVGPVGPVELAYASVPLPEGVRLGSGERALPHPRRPLPVPPTRSDRVDALTVLREREAALAQLTRRSASMDDVLAHAAPVATPEPAEVATLPWMPVPPLAVPTSPETLAPPERAASVFSTSSDEEAATPNPAAAASTSTLAPPTTSAPAPSPGLSAYSELDLLLARLEFPTEADQQGGNYDDLLLVGELLGNAKQPGCSPAELGDLNVAKVELLSRRVDKQGRIKSKMSVTGVRCIDCGICLGRFKVGESAVVLPKCLHVFHDHCVTQWLTRARTCATCREEVFDVPEEPLVAV